MKLWSLLLLLQMVVNFINGKRNFTRRQRQKSVSGYEIIYPKRIHNTRAKRDVSNDEINAEKATFHIKSKDRDFIIDLNKRSLEHHNSIFLRTYEDSKPVHQEEKETLQGVDAKNQYTPNNCYYDGKIRGNLNSDVFINTCRGLTGSIYDGESLFDIQPLGDDGSHKFENVDEEISDLYVRLRRSVPQESKDNTETESTRFRRSVENLRHFELVKVDPVYKPYLTTNQTRFIEVFASCDTGMKAKLSCREQRDLSIKYSLCGVPQEEGVTVPKDVVINVKYNKYNNDIDYVLERVLNAILQVDKAYQAINIRLVLVALEIQTEGARFTRSKDGSEEISTFRNYVEEVIKKSDEFKNIRFDNGMWFSSYYWDDCAGRGYLTGMCGSNSIAIDAWSFGATLGPTVVIGHELGHNLGFPHDASECNCLTERGCFMGGSKSARPGFTDCNMKELQEHTFACMDDYPVKPLFTRCGDGIIGENEECDCGTPETCAMRGDNCCDPYKCRLKPHKECSHINHPQCCDKQCMFKSQGTLCREENGNCDLPEYCPGDSPVCPTDVVRANGVPCDNHDKLVVGTPERGFKTTVLTPPVTTRHVKFLPQKWGKNGWVCMQFDLYGCPPDQDFATTPTPISGVDLYYHSSMCVTPNITSCDGDIPDGTKLIFLTTGDCDVPHMQFTFGSDGTLTHHCSGKKVCPSDDGEYLILSSQCDAEEAKYARTEHSSLKQISSGKCVNSYKSWPYSGHHLKLRDYCDDTSHKRNKLEFLKHDCILPLGMRSGKIPESAITTGSTHGDHSIEMLRLKLPSEWKAWCSSEKNDASWVQVDLGERRKITEIVVGGTYWSWVTGYHLQYSDDGLTWKTYRESGVQGDNSVCYEGTCASSYTQQCQNLWNADAKKASEKCWQELNTNTLNGYGTCSLTTNTSCAQSNMYCGQIQCMANQDAPYYVDYGASYKEFDFDGNKCSGAVINRNLDEEGIGMVADGTKCADGKLCINQQCKTPSEHGTKTCIKINGIECNNKGTCTSAGKCLCEGGYNPEDGCKTLLQPINGGWNTWSTWTKCTTGCNGGIQSRYRACNTPYPKYGGNKCDGETYEERKCNTEACPLTRSCKALQLILKSQNRPIYDGVYTIEPEKGVKVKTYCDMTRNGGGWTLIVAAFTNIWTAENVQLRNADNPDVKGDYSILKYADAIKHDYLIKGTKFQYRLEAHAFGEWGGVFETSTHYKLNSNDSTQTNIKVIEKFNDWEFEDGSYPTGIEKRLPYIHSETRLTMSSSPGDGYWNSFGSITDNLPGYHPAKWIRGDHKMGDPEHIWYWLREGDYHYPKSCLEIMFRGFNQRTNYKSGVYKIEPSAGKFAETYCDFDRYGGGWTLVNKITTDSGWNADTVLQRNINHAQSDDYSILGLVDNLRKLDLGEKSYQYIIEADGTDQNGGMFSISADVSMLTESTSTTRPKLLKKFGNWDEATENLGKNPPHIKTVQMVYLTTGNNQDKSGAIMQQARYLSTLPNPKFIKVWIREGGSRKSCNDLKIHGVHKGKTDYKDGFYILLNSQLVYCDMTTDEKEGWTLLVTSASKGWTPKQVLSRNKNRPSLFNDYSILEQGDSIKALSNSKTTFKYMLDADERRLWGGIWEAKIEYSFVSTSNKQTSVKLLKKFSEWDYNVDWWRGPCPRMPYLGDPTHYQALLTTAQYDNYFEWGSLVYNTTSYHTARWITPQHTDPKVIWYWVNENDCDTDYQKINGGVGEWSEWTACSVSCGSGQQTRVRECNNPKPRCGGDLCDVNLNEVKECNLGTC